MNLPTHLFDGDVRVQTLLCQPDKTIIGEIIPYDYKANFKFNTYSEISFTVDKYYNDLITGETRVHPYYKYIESLRVIYIIGVGHFIIQDVDENLEDNDTKSVTCFSLEYATGNKYLENFYVNTGEEGSVETMYHAQTYGVEYSIDEYYTKITNEAFDPYQRYYIKQYSGNETNAYNYVEEQVLNASDYNTKYNGENSETTLYIKKYPNVRFYWPTRPELSLLHLVFDRIPEWKIGHVDKELWYQERTFSEDRTAIYDFLYNTATDTLDFVMVWDSINGVCNFYKTEEDGVIRNTYVQTNVYNPSFTYYSDDKGIIANPQPTSEAEVQNGVFYINAGMGIETQWDTDVFVSRENLAQSIDIKYSTDDIKTKLKITGSDDLDVRDVNLGQNYILNLNYYNTPSWFGQDLHLKYNDYIELLNENTAKYKEFISAWSAAYNEYSDLMNYVPVEPRVMLVGDVFDKLYCVYNPYLPINESTKDEYDDNTIVYKYNQKTLNYIEAGTLAEADLKNGSYYIYMNAPKKEDGTSYTSTIEWLTTRLQTKLELYKVDQDDKGNHSTIARTDDVLLTLENNTSDTVTIRVRYKDENSEDYQVLRTLTTASTGVSNTIKYSLKQWVSGELTATTLGLVDSEGNSLFKIKSIGTLGAFFCLTRDETEKANLEDYGIKLLEEKQDTYTKIFITQTEGYMNQEGSQCIASATQPKDGGEYPSGTKWLNTDAVDSNGKLIMMIYDGSKWNKWTPDDNDYENYARFYENYEKLNNVQAVLAEKQRRADYLLNGIAINVIHLNSDDINLNNLLRAAIIHFVTLDYDIYITRLGDVSPSGTINENAIWFQTVDNNYSLYTIVRQYKDSQWVEISPEVAKISLTEYNKEFGYITFILDPQYMAVNTNSEYSVNETYFLFKNGQYIMPQVQPINTEELTKRYECVITTDIVEGTECFFNMNDTNYSFVAPQIIKQDSILVYHASSNTLIVGINSIEPTIADDTTDMTELQFTRVAYYTVEGIEYACYVIDDTPYVSYAHSQGINLAKMNVVKEETDMNNFFSKQELVRLSPFIREDEFSDSNFLLTGYESEEEEMNIKQELLNAGMEELQKICQPKLSFDCTMANILAIPQFAPIRDQFKLGNFIRIDTNDGIVKRTRLLEVSIDFDDPSDFGCVFGDLITTKSEIDRHADLLQQAVTAGKSVASNQSKWQKGADVATSLEQAINDGLKDAALSVSSSQGQNITWDSRGIVGRKLREGTEDVYEDEQFMLTNNKLVFTGDGWKTAKSAFGKFVVDGVEHFGVLADSILGGYIEGATLKGGTLEVGGGEGQGLFRVNSDGSVEIKTSSGDSAYASNEELKAFDDARRFSTQIEYSGSTIFAELNSSLTLTAKIYSWNEDVTDEVLRKNATFSWIRTSQVDDTVWNNNHKDRTSNSISITNEDVVGNAHFQVEVKIPDDTGL